MMTTLGERVKENEGKTGLKTEILTFLKNQ
jgi:hypothetical protein